MKEEGVVMPQVHSLFANLKSELKAKGLTYKDVAEHLELTETSVKRLFSAEDMTLKRLDSICDLLGVDLAEPSPLASSARSTCTSRTTSR